MATVPFMHPCYIVPCGQRSAVREMHPEFHRREEVIKRIYLAGPMTGYEDFNFPAFHKAAAQLRSRGYTVFNPAEKETLEGTDKPDPDNIAVEWGGKNPNKTIAALRAEDFDFIMHHADAVVVMRGWERSRGALSECLVAQVCGKPIYVLQSDGSIKRMHRNWVFSVVINWQDGGWIDTGNPPADERGMG